MTITPNINSDKVVLATLALSLFAGVSPFSGALSFTVRFITLPVLIVLAAFISYTFEPNKKRGFKMEERDILDEDFHL